MSLVKMSCKRGNSDLISSSSSESSPEKKIKKDKAKKYDEWDEGKVADYLKEKGCEFAVKSFRENLIDGSVLTKVNDAVLNEMELTPLQTIKLRQVLTKLLGDFPSRDFNTRPELKVFNEPIHGHIEMHPLCVKIIDTPQFQRLRFLKQLGGCYFVFPGASHNRFEHSLGVCHLAGQLVRALRERQPELHITDSDVLCVEIAGLCHDLGHGPFSHLFDGRFIPAIDPHSKWCHEETSVKMFEHLVDANDLRAEFEKWGLTETDRIFIQEQIAGPRKAAKDAVQNWPYQGRGQAKSFLYEVVANKRNGIDVDKWDYFARDCHQLGITNNFDHSRFIKFAKVLTCDQQQEMQICTRDKEVGTLYDMFNTRLALHRRAYQHKTSTAVEVMITEALVKANDHIQVAGTNGRPLRMSEAIHDMVAYTKLTDGVFERILTSDEPALAESRHILHNILTRQLYRCLGQTRLKNGHSPSVDEKKCMREEICKYAKEFDDIDLSPDILAIEIVSFDYGKKDENPVDNVRFYTKSNPDIGIKVLRHQESLLLPNKFSEKFIRVYCKSFEKPEIKASKQCFNKWCHENGYMLPKGAFDPMSSELTPLKMPPPEKTCSMEISSTVRRQLSNE